VAADVAGFALGYGALGLKADGGNTWFLPRMVGMRGAQEFFLLNRSLTAHEAIAVGLVSRLAPDDVVESEAATVAAKLAAGPTRAVRRMLRQSFGTGSSDQLDAEKESVVEAKPYRRRTRKKRRICRHAPPAIPRRMSGVNPTTHYWGKASSAFRLALSPISRLNAGNISCR
jgi:enoyl-CoA hydratase/carnithine racemase